jgi:hypothetical protein
MNDTRLRVIAACGLVAGAILGIAGTFVPPPMRGLAWGLDGIALVVASALLTLYHFRQGHDLVGAGFLVFAVGQGLILSGAAMDPGDTVSSFAAGAGLWAAGLTLISVPRVLPFIVRILGLIAAVLFAIFAIQVFSGNPLTSLSTPLPLFAYPFLVVTLLCWAWVYFRALSGPR